MSWHEILSWVLVLALGLLFLKVLPRFGGG